MERLALLTLCVVAADGGRALAASDTQSLDSIRDAATHHLAMEAGAAAKQSHFDTSALDPRLRLMPCPAPLEALTQPAANQNSARVTVGVRCTAGPRWTVYVPVTVSSNVKVLVLKQSLQRGAHIGQSDVSLEERHIQGMPTSAVTDIGVLAGKHLLATQAGGTALSLDMLASDALIKRGQQVTLIASVGGIQVLAAGQALSEAGSEGRLKVQNLSSLRVVEGVAESADRVRVSP